MPGMTFLVGFLIAFAVGLTGVGAGSITAPVLVLFFGLPAAISVGTALMFAAVMRPVSNGSSREVAVYGPGNDDSRIAAMRKRVDLEDLETLATAIAGPQNP